MLNDALHSVGQAGESLPAWFLLLTAWTGALLLLAFALDRVLTPRVRPAWRLGLYLPVFVRLALGPDWHAPLGFLGGVESAPSAANGSATTIGPFLSAAQPTLSMTTPPAMTTGPGLGMVLGLAFVLGTLTLLSWIAASRWRLHKALLNATRDGPEGTWIHATLGPLTAGLVRSRIVLPRHLVRSLDQDALRHVIAHEQAHVRRGDPAFALALALITAAAWPILPVWLAAARVRQLMEQAADDLALAGVPEGEVRAYARTLLRLSDGSMPRLAAPEIHLSGFRNLRGRLVALARRRRWPASLQAAVAVAFSAAPLACAGLVYENPAVLCGALKQGATALHHRWENDGKLATLQLAADKYEQYSEVCHDDGDYLEMLHHRAEILWTTAVTQYNAGDRAAAREMFQFARDAFRRALDAGGGKFERDAAYGQMLALFNEICLAGSWVGFDGNPNGIREPIFSAGVISDCSLPRRLHSSDRSLPASLLPPDSSTAFDFPRAPYTDDEARILEAYDTYVHHVTDPADPDLARVLYHRAKLAMQHNRFEEAQAPAEHLLKTSDGTRYHVWAAEIVFDVLRLQATTLHGSGADRARGELQQWSVRLASMKLMELDEAERLRTALEKYRSVLGGPTPLEPHQEDQYDGASL